MASTFTITASQTVTFAVQRTNVVPNPAPASATGYTMNAGAGGAASLAYTATGGPTGGGFNRATWTTANNTAAGASSGATLRADGRSAAQALPIPVTPGVTYSASLQARSSIAQLLVAKVFWFDAAGSNTVSPQGAAQVVTAGAWSRLTVEGITAPAGAAFCIVGVTTAAGAGAAPFPVGATLDLALAQLEAASTAGAYFDGSTASVGDQSQPGAIKYAWTGAASASASTQSVAAIDPTVVPSVKLVVTQSGTPALSSVTVNRTDQAGNVFPVRTSDGDVLTISGGTGTVYDYEAPYGQTLTYTVAANNSPTATVTLSITQAWLVHLGFPRRSVPLDFPSGAAPSLTRAIPQATYSILGSAFPIVISGGARQAPAQTLTVQTQTAADLAALGTVLSDGCPLLLNVPASLGLGLDSAYIAVGAVTEKRATPLGTDLLRMIDLPYQVIGRPFGPAQAPVIWSDLPTESWSAIPSGTAWAQLATP